MGWCGWVTVGIGLICNGALSAGPGSVTVGIGLICNGALSAGPGSVTVGIGLIRSVGWSQLGHSGYRVNM